MRRYRNRDVSVQLSAEGFSRLARENALLRAADRQAYRNREARAWLACALCVVGAVIGLVNLLAA